MTDFPEGFQGSGPMFAALPVTPDGYLEVSDASIHLVETGDGTATAFLDEADAAEYAGPRDGTYVSLPPATPVYEPSLDPCPCCEPEAGLCATRLPRPKRSRPRLAAATSWPRDVRPSARTRTRSRERTGGRMNNDHWPVYDQATAEPKDGYNPFAWSPEAEDDWPVPYTVTPAAEALLETEAGA